jgi:hypothetical protein
MKTISDIMWETMSKHLRKVIDGVCDKYEKEDKYHIKKFYENGELQGFCVYYDEKGVRYLSDGHYLGKNRFVALKMWKFMIKDAKILRAIVQKSNLPIIEGYKKRGFTIINQNEFNIIFEKVVN